MRVRVRFPDYLHGIPPNQQARVFSGEYDPDSQLLAVDEIEDGNKQVVEPFAVHVASGAVLTYLEPKAAKKGPKAA